MAKGTITKGGKKYAVKKGSGKSAVTVKETATQSRARKKRELKAKATNAVRKLKKKLP